MKMARRNLRHFLSSSVAYLEEEKTSIDSVISRCCEGGLGDRHRSFVNSMAHQKLQSLCNRF